jgi:hypothetical protein
MHILKSYLCCLTFAMVMMKGQPPPGVQSIRTGTCEVSNNDIFFFPGNSAQGSHFAYAVSTPLFAQYEPTFFRVTRVVGPGLPVEFDPTRPGAIQPNAWPTYVQNKVVSPSARVEVSAAMIIDPVFYDYTHLEGGDAPVTVNANVTFTLNGVALTQPVFFSATVTSPTTITQYVSLCVTVDASVLRFASRLIDPSTGASIPCADQQQTETTCPGINEVEALTQSDHGTTGLNFVNGATKIIFRAMAPIVLVGGCCNEAASFWGGTINSNDFLYTFGQNHLPYSTRSEISQGGANGVLSGTIMDGAGSLNVQIPLVAKEFGAAWVHLVAHSKGGLNARYLLGEHWLEPQGVGVLSLTTLDTPHLGALGAVIIGEKARNHLLNVPGQTAVTATLNLVAKVQASNDAQYHTIADLTPDAVTMELNNLFTLPPVSTTLLGVTQPMHVRALSSDANVDGSALSGGSDAPTNLGWRTISISEGRNLAGALGQALNAPEVMYNANGTITGVQPSGQTRTGQNGQPITIINPIYGQTFQWNDCVVTIASQQYAAPFFSSTPFQSLTPTQYAKGSPYGNNHNSLSNSTISALVSTFVQSISQ